MAAGPPVGDPRAIGGDGQPPSVELPGGFDGGPPGAMAGMAFGGLIGTISAIEDGGLTLATQAGESRSIATDASTLYLRQASIEASDLSPGDRVRIASQRRRPSLVGADPDAATGPDPAADESQQAEGAAQVTVIPAGSPASQFPGVTEGTLVAVVEDGIVVQTDAGDTQVVSTSAATAYARQEVIEAGLLKAGDRVSVQLPFSGPPGQAATAAEDRPRRPTRPWPSRSPCSPTRRPDLRGARSALPGCRRATARGGSMEGTNCRESQHAGPRGRG